MGKKNLEVKSACCKATVVEYKGVMGRFPVKHYTCSKCGERVQPDGKRKEKP